MHLVCDLSTKIECKEVTPSVFKQLVVGVTLRLRFRFFPRFVQAINEILD